MLRWIETNRKHHVSLYNYLIVHGRPRRSVQWLNFAGRGVTHCTLTPHGISIFLHTKNKSGNTVWSMTGRLCALIKIYSTIFMQAKLLSMAGVGGAGGGLNLAQKSGLSLGQGFQLGGLGQQQGVEGFLLMCTYSIVHLCRPSRRSDWRIESRSGPTTAAAR